jgi:hypothetical protein
MASVQKELDALLDLLNSTPDEPKRRYPEIGYYYAMGAYGGAKLVQIINEGGGVRDVLPHLGYVNRPTLVKALRSFLAGKWELAEEQRREIRKYRAVYAAEYAAAYWASQEKPKRIRKATATA